MLPGGISQSFVYGNIGRLVDSRTRQSSKVGRVRKYHWGKADRLLKTEDSCYGTIAYEYNTTGYTLKSEMMNRKKIAVRVIKEELTGFGFYQNGKEWFLGSDEVVFVLALQKSSFDDFLYFNVGIYICCLSVITKTPKERECHIRTRLEDLFVHQIGRTPPNLYYTDTDEDFEKSLRILLRQFLCPLLSPLTNISGLKELYRNNVFANSLVSREAREIISNQS